MWPHRWAKATLPGSRFWISGWRKFIKPQSPARGCNTLEGIVNVVNLRSARVVSLFRRRRQPNFSIDRRQSDAHTAPENRMWKEQL
jgi:hypothetical protein